MHRFAAILTTIVIITSVSRVHAQDVKYERYKLANGMTVILHEDHSLPVACVNIWYHVGSKDEAERRSGFAHLFEHLMFMGTRRAPEGQFDTIMEAGGGYNNASTSEDRTNYFSFGPSNLLSTLLWLDADRLEDLGKEITLEKLNKQRDVVRNERRQTGEMQPYGKAELMVPELMFPKSHPYGHTVIGSHEDLEAATVEDVVGFFDSYYVPSNASLVVAGDFKPAEIKPVVEKLFGTLPKREDAPHRKAEPYKLDGVKRETYTDKVQFPRTYMVYHSPAHFQAGDAEMDLAAAVLGEGKSSRLYQRLIYKDKLATNVSVYQSSMMLSSLFYIEVTGKAGMPLDKIEKAIDEEVAVFIEKGPTAEELQRQQATMEMGFVTRMQSLLSKADAMNQYNFFFGEPNGFKRDLDRYRAATVNGVRDWAKKVLTADARLIMRVLPEGEAPAAAKVEDKKEQTAESTAAADAREVERQPEPVAKKDVKASEDVAAAKSPRDEQPVIGKPGEFKPQMPETFTLSNGIKVQHWRKSELPLVEISLMIRAGAANDPAEKAGRATLMAGMLDEGAGALGAVEFSDALDLLGAQFSAAADQETTNVELSVLKRNLDKALALYADAILRPKFDEKEWDRVRTLHVEGLKRAEDQPAAVAGRVGMRAFYGDKHPYGRAASGTVESVSKLTPDDLRAFHAQMYMPKQAMFFVAGDLTAEEAKAVLEKSFSKWKTSEGWTAPPAVAIGPAPSKDWRVVVVDKPDAVQTVIRFYMPGPNYGDVRRIPLQLMNVALGGSFTSRLNQNLRERNGFTYGARSSFNMAPKTGYFTASADVKADVTGAALKEFFAEFEKIRGGDISKDECAKAAQTQRTNMIQSFQGLSGILSSAQTMELNGRSFAGIGEDLAAIGQKSAADLNKIARDAIPLEHGLLIMVGDKKMIREQIKGLELPTVEELDVRGEAAAESRIPKAENRN